ncbi:MAG: prepilin peptidase [Clostridia bacterium]|nr:prepilin peptidase [Clostridia bacterium]NCC75079.1 prepilin peptidase [Clostridia bacterium]
MALIYGLFGLLIGSFLNVCVYRLPRGESIARGRSHCPSCGHVLSPLDLVPVLSYLALGRRCRYCQTPISPRYAVVESLTALLYATAGFSGTWTGLVAGWPSSWLLLAPLVYVIVLSVFWTWHLMRTPLLQALVKQALLVAFIQLLLPFFPGLAW